MKKNIMFMLLLSMLLCGCSNATYDWNGKETFVVLEVIDNNSVLVKHADEATSLAQGTENYDHKDDIILEVYDPTLEIDSKDKIMNAADAEVEVEMDDRIDALEKFSVGDIINASRAVNGPVTTPTKSFHLLAFSIVE